MTIVLREVDESFPLLIVTVSRTVPRLPFFRALARALRAAEVKGTRTFTRTPGVRRLRITLSLYSLAEPGRRSVPATVRVQTLSQMAGKLTRLELKEVDGMPSVYFGLWFPLPDGFSGAGVVVVVVVDVVDGGTVVVTGGFVVVVVGVSGASALQS